MTAEILDFPPLTLVPPYRPLLVSWNPPRCPRWCAGGHDVPGAEHSHWQTIAHDIDTSNGHWFCVSLQQAERATEPVVALDIDDTAGGPEMTVAEAKALIKALRAAVRKARK